MVLNWLFSLANTFEIVAQICSTAILFNFVLFALEIEQDNELYEDEDVDCLSCNNEKENCCCEVILNHFIELNRIIAELDLIEHLSSPAIASVVYLQVRLIYLYKKSQSLVEMSNSPRKVLKFLSP